MRRSDGVNDGVAELGLLPDPLAAAGADGRRRRQSARVPHAEREAGSATARPGRRTARAEIIEASPAHVVQNEVEAAFARSDLFERGG